MRFRGLAGLPEFFAASRNSLDSFIDGPMTSYPRSVSSLMSPAEGHTVDLALHACFRAFGAIVRTGSAPLTKAEKQLQKDIESLKRALGHDSKKK